MFPNMATARRFDSISERISQLQPPKDVSTEEPSKDPSGGFSGDSERSVVNTAASGAQATPAVTQDSSKGGAAKPPVDAEMPRDNESTSTTMEKKSGVRGEERPTESGGGDPPGEGQQGEEEKLKREEQLEKLEREREGIALDMLHCTDYHSVWLDSNADDGLIGDMFEDDDDDDDAEEATQGEDTPNRVVGDDVVARTVEETKEDHQEAGGDGGNRNDKGR